MTPAANYPKWVADYIAKMHPGNAYGASHLAEAYDAGLAAGQRESAEVRKDVRRYHLLRENVTPAEVSMHLNIECPKIPPGNVTTAEWVDSIVDAALQREVNDDR